MGTTASAGGAILVLWPSATESELSMSDKLSISPALVSAPAGRSMLVRAWRKVFPAARVETPREIGFDLEHIALLLTMSARKNKPTGTARIALLRIERTLAARKESK